MEPQPCPMLKGKLFLGHATEVDVHISYTKIPRLEMSMSIIGPPKSSKLDHFASETHGDPGKSRGIPTGTWDMTRKVSTSSKLRSVPSPRGVGGKAGLFGSFD